ncbi:MAG TPA: FmdB family zinc ribbon protein [Burkholderiales bacterium]|jgi:putative FmdB family regulatory protein
MPFYEYECEACGHQLEALQKISDAPLRKCPHCGKSRLRRLISPPVFRLKGSGWYETDFKSDKEGKRNLAGRADKEESAASATPAEAKTDTKTEAKAEPKAESKAETKSESRTEATGKRTSVTVNKPARRPAARKRPRKR